MKNKNAFLISLILVCVFACSLFIMTGGIKGESAYDVAVRNGFVGTETEWLASLKGKDGQDAEAFDYYQMYTTCLSEGSIKQETSYLQFIQSLINTGNHDAQLLAIQNSIRSSVSVINYSETGTSSSGSGSFFRIDDDGTAYIVTNYHVTYNANPNQYFILLYEDNYILDPLREGKAYLASQYGIEATYVGGSKEYDIGVLKVSANEKLAQYKQDGTIIAVDIDYDFALGKTDLVAGTACYAIGNAMGEGISATQGIISVVSENMEIPDVENSNSLISTSLEMRAIRTSCQINGGNSGGGLYTNNGKLIGIVNARRERQSTSSNSTVYGVGYAIPISVAYAVYNKILLECEPMLGVMTTPTFYKIGVEVYMTDCTSSYDVATGTIKIKETLVITKLTQGGYAEGKLQVEDQLLSYTIDYASDKMKDVTEDIELNHMYNLNDAILSLSTGDKLTLNVLRKDTTQEGTSLAQVAVVIEIN